MSELDAADQRAFLRFVTGCPRLPPGGLTALQPRLTVVRKHPRWVAVLVWGHARAGFDVFLPNATRTSSCLRSFAHSLAA